MTIIDETNIAKLIAAHSEGIKYEEKYAVGWLAGESPDTASDTLKTIAAKYPDAEIAVYGDGTIGIEIGGKLWAAQSPAPERGGDGKTTLRWQDWQWLNWASNHRTEDGYGGWVNMGDTNDLRKVA